MAVGQSRTNDHRETHMQAEEVIPQTEITRVREELSLAIQKGGKLQILNKDE